MSPGKISQRVAAERLEWIDRMLNEIQSLPLADFPSFNEDRRNVWTAESCLRRALEALLYLGRHILAKGFGCGVSEYKEIASALCKEGVLEEEDAIRMRTLAGYRNPMVHFYHEITEQELYEICASELSDVNRLAGTLRAWMSQHPDMMDTSL